jgi:hypothetical protein
MMNSVRNTTPDIEPAEARPPDLRVSKLIHHIDVDMYELEIEFRTVKGDGQSLRIPRSAVRSPADIHKKLLDSGALLPSSKGEAMNVICRLLEAEPTEYVEVTKLGGWRGSTFVRRNWSVGEQKTLRLAPTPEKDNPLDSESGTLEGWKAGLQGPCKASSYLRFGIGVSFAAPLLSLIGEDEGAMFNLHGMSSRGKSLTCRASQSVFARASKNDLPTYDLTDRALEELCFERCDLTVVLDEEGRTKGTSGISDARKKTIAFTVASGQGMARSRTVAQQNLANLKWRVLGLTSSEKPLEAVATRRRAEGERVRHIDIGLPNDERGIFNLIPPEKSNLATKYAGLVEDAIRNHHGVALRPYLQALVRERANIAERVNAIVEAFLEEAAIDSDPLEIRFAKKFALVRAGMILAAEYGVAPWTVKQAKGSPMRLFLAAHQSLFSSIESAETFIEEIKGVLKDPLILPFLAKGEKLPSELKHTAWGFRRHLKNHGTIVAIDPVQLAMTSRSKAAQTAILDYLCDVGLVVVAEDGKRHLQVAVSGFPREKRPRWLCLYEEKVSAYSRRQAD